MWRSWLERRTVPPLTQVRFPGAARDFLPRVNFQCRLSFGVHTAQCAITCINICVHEKGSVAHARVWWIMETLKLPVCTIGWVAQLSQLAFPRESNANFLWDKSHWDNTVVKKKKQKKKKKARSCLET